MNKGTVKWFIFFFTPIFIGILFFPWRFSDVITHIINTTFFNHIQTSIDFYFYLM